ncbi:hypothetical protein M0R19_06090 [Candidatus Pacearchaeota archaeon]|jgi:DNA polymerase-1|nr:hypothetical protein [Candidatus Pacearchaeota archaeon]
MTICIIDGNNFAFRANSTLDLSNSKGQRVSVVYGVLNMLRSVLKKFSPSMVVMCYDFGKVHYRLDLLNTYKTNRAENRKNNPGSDEFYLEFLNQLNELYDILSLIGIINVRIKGIEADDSIHLLASFFSSNEEVVIISTDRDLYLAVDTNVAWCNPNKNELVTVDNFSEKTGINSIENFIYYKILLGDMSDNVRGIDGIGPKTATDLVNTYGNVIDNYERIKTDLIEKKKYKNLFTEDALDLLKRNYKLFKLGELVKELGYEELIFEEFELQYLNRKIDLDKFKQKIEEYEFESILNDWNKFVFDFRNILV